MEWWCSRPLFCFVEPETVLQDRRDAFNMLPANYKYIIQRALEEERELRKGSGVFSERLGGSGGGTSKVGCFRLFKTLMEIVLVTAPDISLFHSEIVQFAVYNPEIGLEQLHLGYLLSQVSGYLVHLLSHRNLQFNARNGIEPQILRPIFVTLAYVARARRNERFKTCLRGEERVRVSGIGGGGNGGGG